MAGHGRRPVSLLVCWLGLILCPAARAQDWVDTIFPERSYDFGALARGSKVRHSFKLVNTTDREVRIDSWKAKCGCTDVHIGAKVVPPGAQTTIELTLDTTKFEGPKSSGVTLSLGAPEPTQVDLNVQSTIRSDFTILPGIVDFGTVERSKKPSVTLTLRYSGTNPNFQVTRMETISAALAAELKPIGALSTGGMQYQMTATLDPEMVRDGRFKDEISVYTSDPNLPRVPISVAARIQSVVSATPAVRDLREIPAGSTKEWTVFARATTPFKILEAKLVEGEAEIPPLSPTAERAHILKFKYTAPTSPGASHVIIDLKTDVPNEPPLRLTAFAKVTPASAKVSSQPAQPVQSTPSQPGPAPAQQPAPSPGPGPAPADQPAPSPLPDPAPPEEPAPTPTQDPTPAPVPTQEPGPTPDPEPEPVPMPPEPEPTPSPNPLEEPPPFSPTTG